jgi:hypothetical protein
VCVVASIVVTGSFDRCDPLELPDAAEIVRAAQLPTAAEIESATARPGPDHFDRALELPDIGHALDI